MLCNDAIQVNYTVLMFLFLKKMARGHLTTIASICILNCFDVHIKFKLLNTHVLYYISYCKKSLLIFFQHFKCFSNQNESCVFLRTLYVLLFVDCLI